METKKLLFISLAIILLVGSVTAIGLIYQDKIFKGEKDIGNLKFQTYEEKAKVLIQSSEQNLTYDLENNSVSFKDNKVEFTAPFMMYSSGEHPFEIKSSGYTGQGAIILGVNNDNITVKGGSIFNSRNVNVQKSYTCDSPNWFNYTTDTKEFWCWFSYDDNGTNKDELVFYHNYDSANLTSKTAYWNEERLVEWDVIDNNDVRIINRDFEGFDKWFILRPVNITANETLKLLVDVEVKWGTSGKYYFGFLPYDSGKSDLQNFIDAIANDVFYFLDPWWDTDYKRTRSITCTNNDGSKTLQRYSVCSFELDTTGVDFLNNGDDVRVTYNGSGSHVELDIWNLSSFNNANTTILFQVQNNISASSNDPDYHVWYKNTGATNPPRNRSNVYFGFEDFEDNSFEKWESFYTANPTRTSTQAYDGTYSVTSDSVNAMGIQVNWSSYHYSNDVIVQFEEIILDMRYYDTGQTSKNDHLMLSEVGSSPRCNFAVDKTNDQYDTTESSGCWFKDPLSTARSVGWHNVKLISNGSQGAMLFVDGAFEVSNTSANHKYSKFRWEDSGALNENKFLDSLIIDITLRQNPPNTTLGSEESVETTPDFNASIITTTLTANTTNDNLTAQFLDVSDSGGDDVFNITSNWYENNLRMMILYMPLDIDANDYSGLGNDGTANGATINTTAGINGAYDFDSIDDDINTSATFTGVTSGTLELWAKLEGSCGGFCRVWNIFENGGNYIVSYQQESTNQLKMVINDGGATTYTTSATWDETNNAWHHIVYQWGADGTIVYFDGAKVLDEAGKLNTAEASFILGSESNTGYWNGSMDEVRLWNRTLTVEQIRYNYRTGLNKEGVTTLVSQETNLGDNYKAMLIVHDNSTYSSYKNTSNTLIQNSIIINELTLNTSLGNFGTNETLHLFINAVNNNGGSLLANISWENETLILSQNDSALTNNTLMEFTLDSGNTSKNNGYNATVIIWNSVDELNQTSNTVQIVNTLPTLSNLVEPLNEMITANYTINFTLTNLSTDLDGDTINYEFYIGTNFPPTTLRQNSTTQNYSFVDIPSGNYSWLVRINDGQNFTSNTSIRNFVVDRTLVNSATLTFNSTVYETSNQLFILNLTYSNLTVTNVDSTFIYNNTDYSVTKTNEGNRRFSFYRNLVIPLINGFSLSNTFLFNLSITQLNGTIAINESYTDTQTVENINFVLCNSTINTAYVNFTFADETSADKINGSFVTSALNYSLDPSKSVTKQLSYSNTTDNFEYVFCFDPSNQTTYNDFDIDYSSIGYPQRNYIQSPTLNNGTTNITLYLVATATGQYVTFQVVSAAEQPINNVDVTAERIISGSYQVVESGATGDDGGVTFFLDPDFAHKLTFAKSGYNTLVTTITPTQTIYTVTLSSTAETVNETNWYQGITYDTTPSQDVLNNNTNYTFSFNISSNYFSLEGAGFRLENSSGFFLGQTSCTGETGCLSSMVNETSNFTDLVMHFYWIVDGNYTNGSVTWFVTTPFSSKASFTLFISDFAKLGESFGTGRNADFTRTMIAFFIILLIVGYLTFVAGIYSRLAILGEVFFLVFLFDLLGFIAPVGVDHFITVVIGLLFISDAIWEYGRG